MLKPKISFGIIVLNGEPFTRYCIRSLYPHAHQIIVAEGACFGARNVATPDGHSRDGTLETLRQLKENGDPDNKIIIVTAEDEGHPDGFWPGEKHEQSQAYAKRATGDYLWQVDIDEFYRDEDIESIIDLLMDRNIGCISLKQFGFWGGFDYLVDSVYLHTHLTEIFRIFKWGANYTYSSHRPPTVIDEKGHNVKDLGWLNSNEMQARGIFLYHYSFVFPKQVKEKAEYYKEAEWSKFKQVKWWANNVFMKLEDPFRVFIILTHVSWLEKFRGNHPNIIYSLINDIRNNLVKVETRPTEDIERLLRKKTYKLKIHYYKMINPLEYHFTRYYKSFKRKLKKLF